MSLQLIFFSVEMGMLLIRCYFQFFRLLLNIVVDVFQDASSISKLSIQVIAYCREIKEYIYSLN